MEEDDNRTWLEKYGKIILLFILIAVLIYFAFQSLLQKQKAKQEVENNLKLLNHRRLRLRRIVEKKKNLKRWLDWGFRLTYVIARVLIIGFGIFCAYTANWYYQKPTLEQYLTWLAVLAVIFAAATFLFFGYPTDIFSALKEVKPKLETWIYGKYLGIDDAINTDEKAIVEVEKEISLLNEEKEILARNN